MILTTPAASAMTIRLGQLIGRAFIRRSSPGIPIPSTQLPDQYQLTRFNDNLETASIQTTSVDSLTPRPILCPSGSICSGRIRRNIDGARIP